MAKSNIEWTNNTWNVVTGCTKHSEGCQNCYAEKMHKRLAAMGQEKYKQPFSEVVFHREELEKSNKGLFKAGKRYKTVMWFINSMSDTFHEKITRGEIVSILTRCALWDENNIFQILTKRAERLPDFDYPENVWLGVTVEMAKYKSRMDYLKKTNAKVKFLSCEPLLGDLGELDLAGIDWVIAGGESGKNARPCHPDWVRNIQRQCRKQNIPFFFKQWGEWVTAKEIKSFEGISKVPAKIMLKDGTLINGIFADDIKRWKNTTGRSIKEMRPVIVLKFGKSKSGAMLDGVKYKEFPKTEGI